MKWNRIALVEYDAKTIALVVACIVVLFIAVMIREHINTKKGETGEDLAKVREVLKHGTLSVGFIGLAETLVALTGKHHGESEHSQRLGLEIIARMRARMDAESQKTGLNFSLLATPAEGLSGRFIRIDKKRFGEIPGVTDRDYYTNSFHIPVYYPISAFEKIKLEAPYHALTNAGHISYVEMDGDPLKNLDAFEKVIRCMKEAGIGYGSVNHPVDRDPCCGYTGRSAPARRALSASAGSRGIWWAAWTSGMTPSPPRRRTG